jgi:mRNA interferase RelE/StbE
MAPSGSYKVFVSRTAEKALKSLPKTEQKRVVAAIVALSIDPYPIGFKKLSGEENTYRIRSGHYRIIYEIIKRELTITLLKIGHRRDIYR